jgi:hypothetical protein
MREVTSNTTLSRPICESSAAAKFGNGCSETKQTCESNSTDPSLHVRWVSRTCLDGKRQSTEKNGESRMIKYSE